MHTFAIVIPAHNEEKSLGNALTSCELLDYPSRKYEMFVVADNCTDGTVEVAQQHRAKCLERNDPGRPGKGAALEWAFQNVLGTSCDAIVVLDADCELDRNALAVFDQCLRDGFQVLQCNHVISNCDAAPTCYIARVGQLLEYDYCYAPKSCFRLAVPLVGTGMVFHREVLERHPWDANSVVEDIEYTLLLARMGIAVQFVANVAVHHACEEHLDRLKVQRRRWAAGTLRIGRGRAIQLILEGVFGRRRLLVDAGWTVLTMSRPLILVHAALTVVLAGLLALTTTEWHGRALLAAAVVVALAHTIYYTVGIGVLGLSLRRARLLFAAPLAFVCLVMISIRSLFIVRDPQWERTPR